MLAGFPSGASGANGKVSAPDTRDVTSVPGSGREEKSSLSSIPAWKIPWSLEGYSPCGRRVRCD